MKSSLILATLLSIVYCVDFDPILAEDIFQYSRVAYCKAELIQTWNSESCARHPRYKNFKWFFLECKNNKCIPILHMRPKAIVGMMPRMIELLLLLEEVTISRIGMQVRIFDNSLRYQFCGKGLQAQWMPQMHRSQGIP